MEQKPVAPPDARTPASDLIYERFPAARFLWHLDSPESPNGFGITAYQIDGAVVLVQQFDRHGWDAYVQASPSGKITDTLDAIDAATKRRSDGTEPTPTAAPRLTLRTYRTVPRMGRGAYGPVDRNRIDIDAEPVREFEVTPSDITERFLDELSDLQMWDYETFGATTTVIVTPAGLVPLDVISLPAQEPPREPFEDQPEMGTIDAPDLDGAQ